MGRALPIAVVVVAAAVWGVAMLGPDRGAPRASAKTAELELEASLPPPAEPVPRPKREPPEPKPVPAAKAPAGDGQDKPLDMGLEPSMLVDSDLNQRHTGEGLSGRQDGVEQLQPKREFDLGEGYLSPEFVEYQTDYAYEPRDGDWARPKEQRVRELLIAAGLGQRIHVVSCRESVCRVQVELDEGDGLARLLEVPGLALELGIDDSTPYSLRANQLSLYARREGRGGEGK